MTPKEAILETVFRWAVITKTGKDPRGRCALCREARERAARENFDWNCMDCIYTKVFKRPCSVDFPAVFRPYGRRSRPRKKLRRAMTLARRCGLRAEALAIIREVFGGRP